MVFFWLVKFIYYNSVHLTNCIVYSLDYQRVCLTKETCVLLNYVNIFVYKSWENNCGLIKRLLLLNVINIVLVTFIVYMNEINCYIF